VCEPVDVPVSKRHLDMVYAHLRYSDKPFMGSVTAGSRAEDSFELARIAFGGDLADRTVLIGLIVTALGALGTYFTENTPQQPWAKQAVGIFTAAVLIVVSAWTDEQFTSAELVQVILAGLGAWQVGTVANSPAGRLSE
jgi:MFS family permease